MPLLVSDFRQLLIKAEMIPISKQRHSESHSPMEKQAVSWQMGKPWVVMTKQKQGDVYEEQ